MGGTGAGTGEWLSLIKFITLLHLGCRWLAMHASEVAGRGVVEGDPAVGVSYRDSLSVGAEPNGPNPWGFRGTGARDNEAQVTGLGFV